MRDYKKETEKRVLFIQKQLKESGAKGIVFGNSGGKDSALVGILCKLACENTVGLIMPCSSKCNYGEDMTDAMMISKLFRIEKRMVDLTKTAETLTKALGEATEITPAAQVNIAPRLRMTSLYAVAATEGRLVAGTGNKSERYVGYFTKWGDGAFDFNPIADLTVTEIRKFLMHLDAPKRIIEKAPSGGLFDGQTDENEMGITYKAIDEYLQSGVCEAADMEIIANYHRNSAHKRRAPAVYEE
ncbi:MAG: NAD(+) synthase [Oscillospiraceae bacterium]|jgi:NAD+ synthase|nr:NAD(+) synthase [Oscillospiraceae bacterium]